MRVFREVAWLKHLGLGEESTLFPRFVGSSPGPLPSGKKAKIYQESLEDEFQYLTYLFRHWSKMNCFTSVSSNYQYKNKIVDRVFLEFDEDDPLERAAKGKTLYELFRRLKLEPYVLFSGSRSYHYHLFFDSIKLDSPKRRIKKWVKSLHVDYLDSSVVGDIRRLSRPPYTIHASTGKYCVPIPTSVWELSPEEILAVTEQLAVGTEFVDFKLTNNVALIESLAKIKIEKKAVKKGAPIDTSSYPPCISAIIERMEKTHHAKHEPRFHVAAFMNRLRKPMKETAELFACCKDFTGELTLYHLRRIYGKDMRCYNCENAKIKGICPLGDSTCPWYPSPNLYL